MKVVTGRYELNLLREKRKKKKLKARYTVYLPHNYIRTFFFSFRNHPDISLLKF